MEDKKKLYPSLPTLGVGKSKFYQDLQELKVNPCIRFSVISSESLPYMRSYRSSFQGHVIPHFKVQ